MKNLRLPLVSLTTLLGHAFCGSVLFGLALTGYAANRKAESSVAILGAAPQSAGQPPIAAGNSSSFGLDADGNRYYSDSATGTVLRTAANGTRTTIASGLKTGLPHATIAVDFRGAVCIADPGNHRILSVAAGSTTPVLRATADARSVAVDTVGNCFYLNGGQLYQLPPTGPPRSVATVPGAFLVAYGPASAEDDTVYLLAPAAAHTYTVSTFTYHNRAGVLAAERTFTASATIGSFVVDTARNLILATESDGAGSLQQVALSGQVNLLATTSPGAAPSLALDLNRNLFYLDGSSVFSVMKSAINFGSVEAPYGGAFWSSTRTVAVAVPPGTTITTAETGNFADSFDPSTNCGFPGNVCHIPVNFIPQDLGLETGTLEVQDSQGTTLASVPLYGTGLYPLHNIFLANGGSLSTPLFTASADVPVAAQSAFGISPSNANLPVLITDVGAGSLVTPFVPGSRPVTGLGKPRTVVQYDTTTYVTQSGMPGVLAIDGKGGRSRVAQRLAGEPSDVAVDDAGNLYIADHNSVFRLGTDGTETPLAEPGTDGGYERADSIAVDGTGSVFAFFHAGGPSGEGGLVRLSPAGALTALVPPEGVRSGTALALDSGGGLYISDGISRTLTTLRSDDVSLALIAGLKVPKGVSGYYLPAVIDQGTDAYVQPFLPNSAFNFGQVSVGQSVTRTYTLVAAGNETSKVYFAFGNGAADPAFTLSSHKLTIAPGASARFSITYKPTVAGAHSAQLITYSNDFNLPDSSPETFSLAGTAIGGK